MACVRLNTAFMVCLLGVVCSLDTKANVQLVTSACSDFCLKRCRTAESFSGLSFVFSCATAFRWHASSCRVACCKPTEQHNLTNQPTNQLINQSNPTNHSYSIRRGSMAYKERVSIVSEGSWTARSSSASKGRGGGSSSSSSTANNYCGPRTRHKRGKVGHLE